MPDCPEISAPISLAALLKASKPRSPAPRAIIIVVSSISPSSPGTSLPAPPVTEAASSSSGEPAVW